MKFQTPRGTRDFLPQEMIKRQYVMDKIRRVFEKWGFDPLDTPAFEDWALLAAKSGGGEEIKKEIYYFKDKSDRELGLRFDLTVPLARVFASNSGLSKPFRRYQIGPVWRYDRPGSGRWREFYQADIDIIGCKNALADAEVIATVCNCMKDLGFDDFNVRINNRKLIEAMLSKIGIKEGKILDVFRSVDKIEKIGSTGVKDELIGKGFSSSQVDDILELIKTDLDEIMPKEKESDDGLSELKDIIDFVAEFGYKENIKPDLSLMRGLDYYTGPVFEMAIGDSRSSVVGGGRYENLIEVFGGKPTPATGWSIGVDRIIEIMEERKLFPEITTKTKIFIAPLKPEFRNQAIRMAKNLRDQSVSCEIDIMGRSIQKQLSYANSKGIPFVVIIGDNEIKEKKFRIKDMKTGKEFPVSMDNMHDILDIVK